MRPDVEDYAEIDEGQQAGGSRAMSWLVLAVAVGGFAALAYYAYNSGTKPAEEGDMITVEADGAPIKEAPVDPEGEEFANKDKTIYDAIAPNGQSSNVEKLLPDAEKPIAAMNVEDSEDNVPVSAATPSQLAAVANNTAPVAPAPATPAPVVAEPAPAASAPSTYVAAEQKTAEAVAETKPEKSYAAPEMINEKKATEPKTEAKAEVKKPEPKTEAKAEVKKPEPKKEAAKPAAKTGGSGTIQLGAYKSEAEAQTAWKKISGANSDVLKGSQTIVKAEVNGGTFYRLRTGVSDAKATCAKLSAKGQACMAVK